MRSNCAFKIVFLSKIKKKIVILYYKKPIVWGSVFSLKKNTRGCIYVGIPLAVRDKTSVYVVFMVVFISLCYNDDEELALYTCYSNKVW